MIRDIRAAGVGVFFGIAGAAQAQVPFPPAPGQSPPQASAELGRISRRMAESLRDLSDDLAATGQAPLVDDCRELQRAAGEWHESTRGMGDPYQLRRSYSGIDLGWHRLRDRLAAPGFAPPAVAQEVARVEQADAMLHQALGLNQVPPNFEGQVSAPPSGIDEARRLAYGVAQRGEALAAQVQATYAADPRFAFLLNDSAELARLADQYSDGFNDPNGVPPIDQIRQGCLMIVQKADGMGVNLDRAAMPPPLRAAWLDFATALNLLRGPLQLTNVDPNLLARPAGVPFDPNPAGQVAGWAEGLDRQVDELLADFAPRAVVVPEGREMLAELARLRDDVRNFRGDASRGLDPGRLAFEFRDVDADWQRLARRVNRVARGRTGPNIQRVQQIGDTCAQIHRVLGMPGYPPAIAAY